MKINLTGSGLLKEKTIQEEISESSDFTHFHPGGSLGWKLLSLSRNLSIIITPSAAKKFHPVDNSYDI